MKWAGASGKHSGTSAASRLESKLRALTPGQKVLTLFLVFLMVYGTLIALDNLFLHSLLAQLFGPPPDLPLYQQRSSLILNGGIIYRDLDIESPPLINYLFVPPQVLGGAEWAYQAWFSLFGLLTALAIYWALRRWDDHYAFIASLLYLLCPFLVEDATFGVRDTPIVSFFVVVPILIALWGYTKGSAAAVAAGFWTKFTPIILYPVMLVKLHGRKEIFTSLGAALLTSALIAIPFLLVCPIEFLYFPTYYLLARPGEGAAGQSVIDLLSRGGLALPAIFGFALTIAVLTLCYLYVYKKKIDLWRGCLLTLVGFLAVYPMVRSSYYMFPWAFLAIWAASSKKMTLRLWLLYFFIIISAAFEKTGTPGFDYSYSWLISLIFMVAGTLVMIDCARIALRERCFLDLPRKRKTVENVGLSTADEKQSITEDHLEQA